MDILPSPVDLTDEEQNKAEDWIAEKVARCPACGAESKFGIGKSRVAVLSNEMHFPCFAVGCINCGLILCFSTVAAQIDSGAKE